MNIHTVTDSTPQKFTQFVSEYAFSLVDADGDIQNLTASFRGFPSSQDWANWLDGWRECGYSLLSQPSLIQVI